MTFTLAARVAAHLGATVRADDTMACLACDGDNERITSCTPPM